MFNMKDLKYWLCMSFVQPVYPLYSATKRINIKEITASEAALATGGAELLV